MPTDKTVLWLEGLFRRKELSTQVSRQVEEERAQAGEGETRDTPEEENPGTDRLRAGRSCWWLMLVVSARTRRPIG